MSCLPSEWMGIGDGIGETDRPHQRYVGNIVADAGALEGLEAKTRGEPAEFEELVVDALEHVANTELPATLSDGRGTAARDDGDLDACGAKRLDAVSVAHVEGFHDLTARSVVQASVGEHSVNV